MRMTGNTVLITGGTSGIGRALAEALHQRGNTVIVAGRRQALLDEIAAKHPGMRGVRLDVQDGASIAALAARVRSEFPALNVLVNNAGIIAPEDWAGGAVDMAGVRSMIETNITSVLEVTAALLPVLRAQASAAVITTTSGLAFVPMAAYPTYSATKAFLHSWLDSLRHQLRGTPVEVLELAPPYVQTELGGPQQAADPNAMPLADYVREVMTLLERAGRGSPEVLVERVKVLRFAEQKGEYGRVFSMLNGG